MVAEVPVKANDTPVPGQLSSLVAGFTRPRYRTLGAGACGRAATAPVRARINKQGRMVICWLNERLKEELFIRAVAKRSRD